MKEGIPQFNLLLWLTSHTVIQQFMQGGLTKQKKYMSSKELYFLPNIKDIRMHSNKSKLIDQHSFTSKYKSIEDVIQNKTINSTKIDHSTTLSPPKKQYQVDSNLYNKYEYLPKIYIKKNRNCDTKSEEDKPKSSIGKEEKKTACQSLIVQEQNRSVLSKQNSSNFNDFFYKKHFKERLQREVDKIQFSIKYDPSKKTMLLHDNLVADRYNTYQNMEPSKKKYTRILTLEKENTDIKQLQKVPSFLLKIINPPRPAHLMS